MKDYRFTFQLKKGYGARIIEVVPCPSPAAARMYGAARRNELNAQAFDVEEVQEELKGEAMPKPVPDIKVVMHEKVKGIWTWEVHYNERLWRDGDALSFVDAMTGVLCAVEDAQRGRLERELEKLRVRDEQT